MEEPLTGEAARRSDRDLANEESTGGAPVWQPGQEGPSDAADDAAGTTFDPAGTGVTSADDGTIERRDQPSAGHTGGVNE